MKILDTDIYGAYIVEQSEYQDERGFFARWYCEEEFEKHGLNNHWKQMNNSGSLLQYTLRGLHFQKSPSQEVKLIRCVSGCIWDVIVDLRPSSESFKKWFGVELSSKNRRSLYVPKGCAHGFLTMQDNSEVIYLVSEKYDPVNERTLIWNDVDIGVLFPKFPRIMSNKDANGQTFQALAGSFSD